MIELCSEYCTVHLTVCSCHITYTFQSESTLYSWLHVKELLARSKCQICSLSDCNWTRTQNHLIRKRTLNHLVKLAKWLSCVLSTYLHGAFDFSSPVGAFDSSSHLNFRFRACFEQGVPWYSGNYRVWIHSETCTWHDKNIQSVLISPLNLQIWSRIPVPSLRTPPPPPHPTVKLRRIKIFRTGFRKLSILSKFWEWSIWQGVRGEGWGDLVCLIMTHCVQKSICNSPLTQKSFAIASFVSAEAA